MKILKLLSIALLLSLCFTSFGSLPALADEPPTLRCGWYPWDPYQYLEAEGMPEEELTGLDVRLVRELFGQAGYKVDYDPVDWSQHQDDIRSGDRDIAAGAFQTPEREKYAYFSDAYREETNVVYVRKQESTQYPFQGTSELIELLRDNPNFRIGIVEGYSTADGDLNDYLQEPEHQGQVIYSQNEYENLVNLVEGKTDAFVSDRLVAATLA